MSAEELTRNALPVKESIEKRYRWNSESVFSGTEEWSLELASFLQELPELNKLNGRLAEGPALPAAALDLRDRLGNRLGKLIFYAVMRGAVDSGDAEARSMESRAAGAESRFAEASAFIEPELIALGEERLLAWTAESPSLAVYRHWLEDLFRQRSHVRSREIEALLGSAGEVFAGIDSVRDALADSDLRFDDAVDSQGARHPVAQSSVEALLSSPDRTLRRSAWESYCDAHLAFGPTLAAIYSAAVKKDVFLARARGYGSSLEAALFGVNIPRSVYDQTLATFRSRLPLWHRYWKAKAAALGLEKMSHWDIWAPLSKKPPKIGYEQAVGWIADALEPLGGDYAAALRKGCLEDRWVDVYPTEGKGGGAFSYGAQGLFPFIKMSWTDDLSSMSTLTHELGHSMHSLHAWKTQPPVYADYSIFVAEVASNFHQAMTRAHLFSIEKDREFQIALVEEAMENFHRYFFIMPILALFEKEVHSRIEAGEGLTDGDLRALMAKLFAEGYGDAVMLDEDREGSTWAQFGHLYANFYVFQYATGISAAHALAKPVLAGDRAAAERYVEFISAGSSVYPVDALARAGVDMTSPAAMDSAYEVLESYIDLLERLI